MKNCLKFFHNGYKNSNSPAIAGGLRQEIIFDAIIPEFFNGNFSKAGANFSFRISLNMASGGAMFFLCALVSLWLKLQYLWRSSLF